MSCLQDDVEIRRKAVPISLSVNLHSRNTQSMQVSHTSCYGMYTVGKYDFSFQYLQLSSVEYCE